jgi:hypothetical protein
MKDHRIEEIKKNVNLIANFPKRRKKSVVLERSVCVAIIRR